MKLNGLLRSLCVLISVSFLSLAGMTNTAKADVSIITLKMSEEAKIDRARMKAIKPKLAIDKDAIPQMLEKLKKLNASLSFPEVELQNTLTSQKYDDDMVYALKDGKKHDTAVIYNHGGGYIINLRPYHARFCDKLVKALDADVYMPLYKLIPYGTYKETFQLLDSLYADLLKKYKKIIIAGDSAGGNITLCYTLYRKEQKMPLPYKVVAYSPLMDMSMQNPDILNYAERDSMLSLDGLFDLVLAWKGDLDVKDYRVSPLYGDLTGMPDLLLFYAQDGILYPDAVKMYNKLQQSGNNAQFVIGVEHVHVFPEHDIPEQKECLRILKEFCK